MKCRRFQVSRSALFLWVHQRLELKAFSKKYFLAKMFSYEFVPFRTFLKVGLTCKNNAGRFLLLS